MYDPMYDADEYDDKYCRRNQTSNDYMNNIKSGKIIFLISGFTNAEKGPGNSLERRKKFTQLRGLECTFLRTRVASN